MAKHRHSKLTYNGLHLGIVRISLSQRFSAHFDGVRRVRLSPDTHARIICLMPSKTQKGPAGPDVFRMTKNARSDMRIHCATLSPVMPIGRYRFVEHTPDGYICRYDPAKPTWKR